MQTSTIKTGISVCLAIFLAKVLKLEFPFFVALAVIMPIEESIASSIKSGKNRMVGTIIGAFIGVIFVLMGPGNPILCGIGMIIIIYVCSLFNAGSAAAIGGIVFISIMVNLKGQAPLSYSINRVFDTLVGACIVITVNYLIPVNRDKVILNVINLESDVLFDVKEVVCLSKEINLQELNNKILSVEGQVNKFVSQSNSKKKNQMKIIDVQTILGLYKNTYEHINMIFPLKNNCSIDQDNYNKLKEIYTDYKIHQKQCKDMKMCTVFNYHVSKIIENINSINESIKSLQ